MAKATVPAGDLSALIKESAREAHGKQAIAAEVIGKAESNFSRDVDHGTLRTGDLERLGPETLARLGRKLIDHYGHLDTPQARLRTQARALRDMASELDQLSEHIA